MNSKSKRLLISLALIAMVATISVAAATTEVKAELPYSGKTVNISGTLQPIYHPGPKPQSVALYMTQGWVSGSSISYGPYDACAGTWDVKVTLTWTPSSQPVDVIFYNYNANTYTTITLTGGTGSATMSYYWLSGGLPKLLIIISTTQYTSPPTVTFSGTIHWTVWA